MKWLIFAYICLFLVALWREVRAVRNDRTD